MQAGMTHFLPMFGAHQKKDKGPTPLQAEKLKKGFDGYLQWCKPSAETVLDTMVQQGVLRWEEAHLLKEYRAKGLEGAAEALGGQDIIYRLRDIYAAAHRRQREADDRYFQENGESRDDYFRRHCC